MARQPFLPKYQSLERLWGLGVGDLARLNPKLATVIADCIAIWPYIEHDMALSLSGLLNSGGPASVGVLTALRGFRAQRDVIQGAASAVLDPPSQNLVAACLTVVWTAQRARDDVAHGVWGAISEHPDKLMWVSGADYAIWNATSLVVGGGDQRELLAKAFIYEESDLVALRDMLLSTREISFQLAMFCLWRPGRPETRELIRDQLLARLPVRNALDRLSQIRNTRSSPK